MRAGPYIEWCEHLLLYNFDFFLSLEMIANLLSENVKCLLIQSLGISTSQSDGKKVIDLAISFLSLVYITVFRFQFCNVQIFLHLTMINS